MEAGSGHFQPNLGLNWNCNWFTYILRVPKVGPIFYLFQLTQVDIFYIKYYYINLNTNNIKNDPTDSFMFGVRVESGGCCLCMHME